ncbi:hypothetical protein EVAR_12324_1 [Eumeta japonica]|uniref:Uncharacterized protein n=1 Tax=Eumeta variegata TaxID=151549 RepID=A0A4C1TUC6_EUMVA|nr:hypothetical protein EVAR_12324_1 [Eumeta japonica]
MFYGNLEEVMRRFPSFGDGTRLFCLDAMGTTTVQKPKRVLATKGPKQLNKVKSDEQCALVTKCCLGSATGSALPLALVFPRKNFEPPMLKRAPTGTLGLAQTTGRTNFQLFPEVVKHFVKNPDLVTVGVVDIALILPFLKMEKKNKTSC